VSSIHNDQKERDTLSPLLLTLLLNMPFGRSEKIRRDWELNETHQFLVCADDINILD